MARKILHLDLDAFYCAVEERRNPTLQGKPFAVGGRPEHRGVVSSCSYAARQKGIHSAMPMAQALHLCRGLLVIPPDHQTYAQVSREVMQFLHELTPLVEQISIDEAFLDVSDLPQTAEEIAKSLQERINRELKLPCSLGVASNKLVAKIANDQGKTARRGESPPNAITIVPPGQEAQYLAPLSTISLWGVGPKTAARLADLSIHTIGEISNHSESELVGLFGKIGHDLSRRARGIDDSPIETSHEMKSISQETTFIQDISNEATLIRTLHELSAGVGFRLREDKLFAKTVKLKLRWSDFTTLSRQFSLERPTNLDEEIFEVALLLFKKTWENHRSVRLIGVGASGLGSQAYQLSLWEVSGGRKLKLQNALDDLRNRYGKNTIRKGGYGKG